MTRRLRGGNIMMYCNLCKKMTEGQRECAVCGAFKTAYTGTFKMVLEKDDTVKRD